MPRKLVLAVVDGLTAPAFERTVESGAAPTFGLLAREGNYGRAVSTFPSLTPVCLSSLATGAHGDVHGIPHLVWFHRGEQRVVEYGSSFAALRAAGFGRALRDTIIDMSARHLSPEAVTVFEALEDAGVIPAAVNFTCYRGRTRHVATLPGVPPAFGPRRFFFFNLFESDATGAPLAVRSRLDGTIDEYAAAVGRWLVTRDGFDFLVFYLSDYDFASHLAGPDAAEGALRRADSHVGALVDAAGGLDEFLERYALILCSDHGQTPIERTVRLEARFADVPSALVTASNRAAMVYERGGQADARTLAQLLDDEPAADAVLFLEDGEAVLRRAYEELRFKPDGGSWQSRGDRSLADFPDALARGWAALHNPNSGDVLVSAAPGFEFADLAGRHHLGGGSHGSLVAGDSEVPMLVVSAGAQPASIVDVAPLVLSHFGVRPPAYARPLDRAAA